MNSPRNWIWFAVSAVLVVAFFFWREHWGHMWGVAPYVLLLACPLLHLFHGHGGNDKHRHSSEADRQP